MTVSSANGSAVLRKGCEHERGGRDKRDATMAVPFVFFLGSSKFFVETPTRIKGVPLTLRRKLRTSFALSYPLLHLISSCGFAAVSIAFRANNGLALGAKHIRRSVSEAPLKPSEFDPRETNAFH